jgi:hypothetical protein
MQPKLSLQIDVSGDVVGLAQLLVFFGYCFSNRRSRKSLCSVHRFQRDVCVKTVNDSFTNCVSIYTDGATALTEDGMIVWGMVKIGVQM